VASVVDLPTLLMLVGELKDGDTATERFRTYLQQNVSQSDDLRAYVDLALSESGQQYYRALQDLVNHLGALLGFDVHYGRYQGVRGKNNHDGLWISPSGLTIIAETKTTDTYTIKTSTILDYINRHISESGGNRKLTFGLYVFGRFDQGTNQLENAVIAEGLREQIRVVSVGALLNLLDMKQDYEIDHATVTKLLVPPPVRNDDLINLMFDIVAQEKKSTSDKRPGKRVAVPTTNTGDVQYFLFSGSDSEDGMPPVDNLRHWLERGMWGIGERTAYRNSVKPGDRLCFYAARTGVVAYATAASPSKELSPSESPKPNLDVPYHIKIRDLCWLEAPIPITKKLRGRLKAFEGRQEEKNWAWLVQGTTKLEPDDFRLLVGTAEE